MFITINHYHQKSVVKLDCWQHNDSIVCRVLQVHIVSFSSHFTYATHLQTLVRRSPGMLNNVGLVGDAGLAEKKEDVMIVSAISRGRLTFYRVSERLH